MLVIVDDCFGVFREQSVTRLWETGSKICWSICVFWTLFSFSPNQVKGFTLVFFSFFVGRENRRLVTKKPACFYICPLSGTKFFVSTVDADILVSKFLIRCLYFWQYDSKLGRLFESKSRTSNCEYADKMEIYQETYQDT